MNPSIIRNGIRVLAIALASYVALATLSAKPAASASPSSLPQRGGQMQQPPSAPPAPKLDPKEEAAYKAFYTASPQDATTRIQLGQDFLQKYPTSRYAESVYGGLVQAYYAKQDWPNFYSSADKALALNPDDSGVLVMVGWIIPHSYNADDPDALKKLDKAETYEKHAIQVIGAMAKPPAMTDDQFTALKTEQLGIAHSGLGLVYFRRQDFDNAVKELQQATQASASPDPADLYVLGICLQRTEHQTDAADAFTRCAQIPGGLQDRCKQSADAAKKQATPSK